MASTNKTTNYELSQFLGTDKPAWLGDYNSDMAKIDAQMKLNADAASGADGKATTNGTNIGTLSNLTTDVQTNLVAAINEVDGHADTAQGTANQANTTAGANATAITNLTNYLDINDFGTATPTVTGGSTGNTISYASNTAGTLGKLYGTIQITCTGSNVAFTFDTPFRPATALTINGVMTRCYTFTPADATKWSQEQFTSFTIGTDGKVSVSLGGTSSTMTVRFNFYACLLFLKNFGDTPIPE